MSRTPQAPAGGWFGALVRSRRLGVALAVVLVAAQCWGLYLPDPEGLPGVDIIGFDKVIHLLMFALPTWALARLWRPWWIAAVAMGVQAVLSEVVQGALLPHRGADVLDALTDATGIAVGALVFVVERRSFGGLERPTAQ